MSFKPILLNTESGTQIARALASGEIGSGAVTFGTIASGAVSSGTIGAAAIQSGNFNSGAVNTWDIASGSIKEWHLDADIAFDVAEMLQDPTVFIAGENISGGRAVALNGSGLAIIAGAGEITRMPAVGVAMSGIAAGNIVRVALDGRYMASYFNFVSGSAGMRAFVGMSGTLTTTPPSASGNIQQKLGTVMNASGVILRVDSEYIQIFD